MPSWLDTKFYHGFTTVAAYSFAWVYGGNRPASILYHGFLVAKSGSKLKKKLFSLNLKKICCLYFVMHKRAKQIKNKNY